MQWRNGWPPLIQKERCPSHSPHAFPPDIFEFAPARPETGGLGHRCANRVRVRRFQRQHGCGVGPTEVKRAVNGFGAMAPGATPCLVQAEASDRALHPSRARQAVRAMPRILVTAVFSRLTSRGSHLPFDATSVLRFSMPFLVRATSLTNYSEVARTCGLDPVRMLLDPNPRPSVLHEPDLMIPVESVASLLQSSATGSGNQRFGLCMAESRRLSSLGAVGLLTRYQPLLNSSLSLMSEAFEQVVVVIREEVKPGQGEPGGATTARQRIELALARDGAPDPRHGLATQARLLRALRAARPSHPSTTDGARRRVRSRLQLHRLRQGGSGRAQPVGESGHGAVRAATAGRIGQTAGDTMIDDVRRAILLLPSGRCMIEQLSDHVGVVCRTDRAPALGRRTHLLLDRQRRARRTRRAPCPGERPSAGPGGDLARLVGTQWAVALDPRAVRLQCEGEQRGASSGGLPACR